MMKNMRTIIQHRSVVILILCICLVGIVSAGTLPLSTTKNGTVSGDLYVGAFQNPPWNNQVTPPGVKEYTQSYTIPAFTTIQWARLETVVYAAGTDNRHGQTTVKFDGNGDGTYETTLGVEDQETASSTDGNVYPVNDHMDRCYSDYRIWYNVTNLITAQNPAAFVKTENLNTSTFDGRVKEITLIVAYNDGDSDQVMYWVNTGHDYQASGAAGVTTSFDTTAVPAGFTTATLRNVGLASKDALYTFNTLTPTGGDPIVPYNYFETHAWDVTSGITAGSASFFGYTNNGGSFKTTLATLTVRSASEEQPDLIVTEIKPNVGAGAYLFANEPNVITINVRNEGIGSAGASTLSVDVGGTVYTTTIIALEAGENSTVTVTDTVSRTGGDTVMVTATADSAGIITESDETNNVLTPAALTVYNNGYKGKRWTGGDDITTQAGPFNGHYGLVYSVGNATYGSAGWTERTTGWTASDLPVPAGATVTSARLYQGYTWDQTPGGSPLWTVTFNGAIISPAATYKDTKGWGTYSDREQGIFVYDVTGQFLTAGNSMTITSLPGNDNGIYGAYLVVVYQDPATSEKTIWINDECDSLYAGTARSVTNDEATAYANFAGVNTSGVANAQAIAFLQSAGDSGKSRFFFNDNEFPGFWPDYRSGPQIGFSSYNVTSALASGANEARLQSYGSGTDGDNMYATNVILVVEKTVAPIAPVAAFSGTPVNGNAPLKGSDSEVKTSYITVAAVTPAPVAAFSGTPVNGNAPLKVVFTDTSSGSITSRAWEYKLSSASTWTTFTLAGDNSYTFTSAGAYDIRLTVTGPGGSDSEVKTSYITVSTPTPTISAQFTASPVSGYTPLAVRFTDQSTGPVSSYEWDFNNDGIVDSRMKNPLKFFMSSGKYTVKQTVRGPDGMDEEIKNQYIEVSARPMRPIALFSADKLSGTAPLNVTFTDESYNNPNTFLWKFGDGATSNAKDPSHTYQSPGYYKVSLTVSNAAGSSSRAMNIYVMNS